MNAIPSNNGDLNRIQVSNEKSASFIFRDRKFFNSRTALIGRTAKLHNFAHNLDGLKRAHLNPFTHCHVKLDGR